MSKKTLTAKPIIEDSYWIVLEEHGKKIGDICSKSGYIDLTIKGESVKFDTVDDIKKKTIISFPTTEINLQSTKDSLDIPYPVAHADPLYDRMYDVSRGLYLYSTVPNSKSYNVAGWFMLMHKNKPTVVLSPKYYLIQRYSHFGPYMTREEAESMLPE